MKIAVFHNLPSGGAKRALYGFVKYLARAGCAVHAFVPSTADETYLPLRQLAEGVTIFPVHRTVLGFVRSPLHPLPVRAHHISLADLEATQRRLAAEINRQECDVVFVEQDRYTMSPFVLKYLAKPSVYYCQQPVRLHEALLGKLQRSTQVGLGRRMWRRYVAASLDPVDKRNASFAKVVLANSYFSREAILRAYGINSHVSYLGVDAEVFRPLSRERESFILSVGFLGLAKGFDFIIRALGRIERRIRPRFVVVSNGEDADCRRLIEDLAARAEVDLEIKKLISDEELVELYNKTKVFVYAPYLEPFGIAPLEAMSCGTPVVAVKEGGVRESIIHNETGMLTDRDEVMFAEGVMELLGSDKKRSALSRRAIEVIRGSWTLQHAGERLLRHLERAIQSCG